jgi:hypothetical protein
VITGHKKQILGVGECKYNGGAKLAQDTLYAGMELSQWNLVLLMSDHWKIK